MKRIALFAAALFALSSAAFAQTSYNRFGPVNGVLVGDSSTYYTSAADSSDIIGLWSGSCSLSTFLRGDGSCASVVATGQPLTRVDDTNVTLTLGGTPATALLQPTSLTLGWTGTLSVPRGGTGVGTLTGLIKGNGTSAFSAATSADIVGLWTGTCTGSNYLAADGTCATVSPGAAGANPSATIGLSAVNGAANTFLRSDGAPALSQSIVPTWTGAHTFNATSPGVTVNTSTAGKATVRFQSNGSTAGYAGLSGAWEGDNSTDMTLIGETGNGLRFYTNGSPTERLTITSGGTSTFSADTAVDGGVLRVRPGSGTAALRLQARTDTSADATRVQFYRADGTTERGYIGYGSNGSDVMTILSQTGALNIATSTGGLTLAPNSGTTTVTGGLSATADGVFAGRNFSAGGTASSSTAVQLCHASSGYGTIGINTVCQSGGGYNYGVNDAAGQIDFGNIQTRGWTFRSAAANTGTISFTDLMTIGNTGNVTATGSIGGASLVVSGSSATVNGQNVCLANGTNCPAGGPTTVFKASATDRSSTTALASDSDLQFAATSGVYKIEFCLNFAGVTTGTQGFKFAFNLTSAGNQPGQWSGGSRVNGSSTAHSGIFLGDGNTNTGGQVAYATITVGNQQDSVCGSGQVANSGSVTYAIQWAQNSSSANATRLGQGSFIQYQKIN